MWPLKVSEVPASSVSRMDSLWPTATSGDTLTFGRRPVQPEHIGAPFETHQPGVQAGKDMACTGAAGVHPTAGKVCQRSRPHRLQGEGADQGRQSHLHPVTSGGDGISAVWVHRIGLRGTTTVLVRSH